MHFSDHKVVFTFSLLMLANLSVASRLSLCTGVSIWNGWMVAICPNDANPPVQIKSSLWLDQIISLNNKTELIWSRNANPSNTFNNCWSFDYKDGKVSTKCLPPVTNSTWVESSLDIAKYVDNYNGYLVSNFTKNATVPAVSDSKVPVPKSFDLWFYFESANGCGGPWGGLDFKAPARCKRFENALNSTLKEVGWSIQTNDGYEVRLWNTTDCSGEPLVTIKNDIQNSWCNRLPSRVYSMSVRPVWNADFDFSLA